MKKFTTTILLIIAIAFSFNTEAKSIINTEKISEKITNTSNFIDSNSLYKTIYNDVKTGVIALAESLHTTANHILEVVGMQYFLKGVYHLIIVLVGFFFLIYFFKKDKHNNLFDNFIDKGPFEMNLILFILSIFAVCTNLQDAILMTFNPEYYVIQDVFEFIKTIK